MGGQKGRRRKTASCTRADHQKRTHAYHRYSTVSVPTRHVSSLASTQTQHLSACPHVTRTGCDEMANAPAPAAPLGPATGGTSFFTRSTSAFCVPGPQSSSISASTASAGPAMCERQTHEGTEQGQRGDSGQTERRLEEQCFTRGNTWRRASETERGQECKLTGTRRDTVERSQGRSGKGGVGQTRCDRTEDPRVPAHTDR